MQGRKTYRSRISTWKTHRSRSRSRKTYFSKSKIGKAHRSRSRGRQTYRSRSRKTNRIYHEQEEKDTNKLE